MDAPRRSGLHDRRHPGFAIEGGRVTLEGEGLPFTTGPRAVHPGRWYRGGSRVGLDAPTDPRHAVRRSSRAERRSRRPGWSGRSASSKWPARWPPGCTRWTTRPSTRDGNVYATFSGTRGQQVPISVFRVRPDGARDPLVSGIVNATSLAFDRGGDLCVSSRFDGTVYRVEAGRPRREDCVRAWRGVRPRLPARRVALRRRSQRHAVPRQRRRARDPVRLAAAERRRVPPRHRPGRVGLRLRADAVVLDVVHRVDRRGEISVARRRLREAAGSRVRRSRAPARRRGARRRERPLPGLARRAAAN